jgi:antitoxin component of RelBE/YafQ-DinJ toxin-antitoxin module
VHVDDETHEQAREFCKQRGLMLGKWVELLIREAAQNAATRTETGLGEAQRVEGATGARV